MMRHDAAGRTRWLYSLQSPDGYRRDLLGGKGAGLAEMTSLGLPVPHGFTITTEACREYYSSGMRLPEGLWAQVQDAINKLEVSTGRIFGDRANPLLVSVRSGAEVSMPGMMDTVLNLGVNQQIAQGIAQSTGNERFALDLYRRFIQMFGKVAMRIDPALFDGVMEGQRRFSGVGRSAYLGADDLRQVVHKFRAVVKDHGGQDLPDDPYVQLDRAIQAVFDSWNSRRAKTYRELQDIPRDLGTAVTVMAMVYGNMDDTSSAGVLFTRSPSTGEKALYGEYLVNAQGEDVVSGGTTPQTIASMAQQAPEAYRVLAEVASVLERHYRDVQDVEFTVEHGKLYILQTRTGKRSARAAIKIAVDMAQEGLITREEALLRVEPEQIYQLLLPGFEERAKEKARDESRLLTTASGASPGAATGKVVFDADTASEQASRGLDVILARPETTAEDVHGMVAAAGVLTSRGGATSHAAVVARGLGKPCVTGAENVEVNPKEGYLRCGQVMVMEGEDISIDGASGEVFVGPIATVRPQATEDADMLTLLEWADGVRSLGVWANADNPNEAAIARRLGAEGIGLCRTEHMFFEPDRLSLVQDMILAAHRSAQSPDDESLQEKYHSTLEELEHLQIAEFEGVFRAMDGKPVVIRLLDPPLHEFLPRYDQLLAEAAQIRVNGDGSARLAETEALLSTVEEMREANPMLGLRGCRVGLMYPAIYEMQTRAILQAAHNVSARHEIMVPLVSHANEMERMRRTL